MYYNLIHCMFRCCMFGQQHFQLFPFLTIHTDFAKWLWMGQRGPQWHSSLMGHYPCGVESRDLPVTNTYLVHMNDISH